MRDGPSFLAVFSRRTGQQPIRLLRRDESLLGGRGRYHLHARVCERDARVFPEPTPQLLDDSGLERPAPVDGTEEQDGHVDPGGRHGETDLGCPEQALLVISTMRPVYSSPGIQAPNS